MSDNEMLDRLRMVLAREGSLSGLIIDEQDNLPSSSSFRSRFGSLLRAYSLVGYAPNHDYRYLEINKKLRSSHQGLVAQIVAGILSVGAAVEQHPETDILTINRELTVSIVVVRCFSTAAGSLRWKLRLDVDLRPDITIAIRMDASNQAILDYYLLPRLDMHEAVLRLAEYNGLSLDAYRFDELESFYRLMSRSNLRDVA